MIDTFAMQTAVTHACNCVGPQNGEPKCPCQMSGIVKRDGRWIQLERDLGPASSPVRTNIRMHGCLCPAGAEKTCCGPLCPRKALDGTAFA